MKAIVISKTMNYYIVLENLVEVETLAAGNTIESNIFLYNYFSIENTRKLSLKIIKEKEFESKKKKMKKRFYAIVKNEADTISIFLSDKWFNRNVLELSSEKDISLNYNDKFNKIIFTKNPLTINILMDSNGHWPLKTY
ncbi:MAG TPA: hypothetical protein PLE28_01570 [bacterium]|nr:hypothetical protein [bacterium]